MSCKRRIKNPTNKNILLLFILTFSINILDIISARNVLHKKHVEKSRPMLNDYNRRELHRREQSFFQQTSKDGNNNQNAVNKRKALSVQESLSLLSKEVNNPYFVNQHHINPTRKSYMYNPKISSQYRHPPRLLEHKTSQNKYGIANGKRYLQKQTEAKHPNKMYNDDSGKYPINGHTVGSSRKIVVQKLRQNPFKTKVKVRSKIAFDKYKASKKNLVKNEPSSCKRNYYANKVKKHPSVTSSLDPDLSTEKIKKVKNKRLRIENLEVTSPDGKDTVEDFYEMQSIGNEKKGGKIANKQDTIMKNDAKGSKIENKQNKYLERFISESSSSSTTDKSYTVDVSTIEEIKQKPFENSAQFHENAGNIKTLKKKAPRKESMIMNNMNAHLKRNFQGAQKHSENEKKLLGKIHHKKNGNTRKYKSNTINMQNQKINRENSNASPKNSDIELTSKWIRKPVKKVLFHPLYETVHNDIPYKKKIGIHAVKLSISNTTEFEGTKGYFETFLGLFNDGSTVLYSTDSATVNKQNKGTLNTRTRTMALRPETNISVTSTEIIQTTEKQRTIGKEVLKSTDKKNVGRPKKKLIDYSKWLWHRYEDDVDASGTANMKSSNNLQTETYTPTKKEEEIHYHIRKKSKQNGNIKPSKATESGELEVESSTVLKEHNNKDIEYEDYNPPDSESNLKLKTTLSTTTYYSSPAEEFKEAIYSESTTDYFGTFQELNGGDNILYTTDSTIIDKKQVKNTLSTEADTTDFSPERDMSISSTEPTPATEKQRSLNIGREVQKSTEKKVVGSSTLTDRSKQLESRYGGNSRLRVESMKLSNKTKTEKLAPTETKEENLSYHIRENSEQNMESSTVNKEQSIKDPENEDYFNPSVLDVQKSFKDLKDNFSTTEYSTLSGDYKQTIYYDNSTENYQAVQDLNEEKDNLFSEESSTLHTGDKATLRTEKYTNTYTADIDENISSTESYRDSEKSRSIKDDIKKRINKNENLNSKAHYLNEDTETKNLAISTVNIDYKSSNSSISQTVPTVSNTTEKVGYSDYHVDLESTIKTETSEYEQDNENPDYSVQRIKRYKKLKELLDLMLKKKKSAELPGDSRAVDYSITRQRRRLLSDHSKGSADDFESETFDSSLVPILLQLGLLTFLFSLACNVCLKVFGTSKKEKNGRPY